MNKKFLLSTAALLFIVAAILVWGGVQIGKGSRDGREKFRSNLKVKPVEKARPKEEYRVIDPAKARPEEVKFMEMPSGPIFQNLERE